MPYTATVYKVFIASPVDLNEERAIARQVILNWNNVHAESRQIILFPIGWEQNAHPAMGDRPQAILNQQLLDSADVLVGIFWTRVGTPTGTSISGSVEEIERHIEARKNALLYFSRRPIEPGLVDRDQFEAVQQLKRGYQSRGLTHDFHSPDQFRQDFQNHLAMLLNEEPYTETNQSFQYPEPQDPRVDLTDDAKELLLECSKDRSGQITKLGYMGGGTLSTNDREFLTDNQPRTTARWEGALRELETLDLVQHVSYDSDFYQITRKGYALADALIGNHSIDKKQDINRSSSPAGTRTPSFASLLSHAVH